MFWNSGVTLMYWMIKNLLVDEALRNTIFNQLNCKKTLENFLIHSII